MIANYHTHTPRCNHAEGTDEEYVQQALKAGLKLLGFSDHAPYPFGNGYRSGIRMDVEELPEYCASLNALKAKYGQRIDIKIGLEAEYYPACFQAFKDLVRNSDVQYLILGQHWTFNEYDGIYNGSPTDDEQQLKQYCRQVLQGVDTGLFSYVAHPDLIRYVGDPIVYEKHIRILCRELAASGTPLELNLCGVRTRRHYPSADFWRIAAEENCVAVFGVDAHRAQELTDTQALSAAQKFARETQIPVLDRVDLRPVR